ncbi:MAG TPA: hypothetical protein PKL08_16015, partial [Thermoanaerobaculaceae bacterium]|nr:hypothetical protein [Thermoanaerobaculaceae bacterium]
MKCGSGRRSCVPERHTHDAIDVLQRSHVLRTEGFGDRCPWTSRGGIDAPLEWLDGVSCPTPGPPPLRLAIAGEPSP